MSNDRKETGSHRVGFRTGVANPSLQALPSRGADRPELPPGPGSPLTLVQTLLGGQTAPQSPHSGAPRKPGPPLSASAHYDEILRRTV